MQKRAAIPDTTTEVRRRLDVMIFFLLESGPEPSKTVTEKIERLIAVGLNDAEIGGIVGKKPNYVGATRSRLKKREKR